MQSNTQGSAAEAEPHHSLTGLLSRKELLSPRPLQPVYQATQAPGGEMENPRTPCRERHRLELETAFRVKRIDQDNLVP
jgi:hypothetical protein